MSFLSVNGSEGSSWVGEGRNYFFVLFDYVFAVRSSQLLSVGRQPFRAIPRCSGPSGLSGPLRVASLIPGGSTTGPLRVFSSRGHGGVAYVGVLNCEGLSGHIVYSAGSYCVAITSCVFLRCHLFLCHHFCCRFWF